MKSPIKKEDSIACLKDVLLYTGSVSISIIFLIDEIYGISIKTANTKAFMAYKMANYIMSLQRLYLLPLQK